MSIRLGANSTLYRNTNSYATPTWSVINNVRDLDIPEDMEEADATTRGSGKVKMTEPTLLGLSLEWEMIENPADTDYTTLLSDHFNRTLVDLTATSGSTQGVSGETFVRFEAKIIGWKKSEPLAGINMVKVTAKPCYSTNAVQVGTY